MFLHLGNGVLVPLEDIIFIGDYALFTQNGPARELLAQMQEQGCVVNTLPLHPHFHADMSIKSVIQTKEHLYLSMISPLTLKRRSEKPWTAFGLMDSEIDLEQEEQE